MNEQLLVSIVIANYNGREFIGECIDSVLRSTYPHFEVLVVDNASTDGSFSYLKKKYSKNNKVRLFRSEKQLYFTGGCNLGAKTAKGEKLFFLNSDTVIDKNCLKELVNFSATHKKHLVQPKILVYSHPQDGKGSLRNARIIDNVGGKYSFFGFGYGIGREEIDRGQYDKNRQVDFVNGTAFIIDRNFFWKLGGFDESFRYFYEDVDLSLRAKRQGGQCWYCAKSLIYHKGSLTFKKNVSLKDIRFYIRRNRLLTLMKNESIFKLLVKFPLLIVFHLILWLRRLIPSINQLRLWELKKVVKKDHINLLDLGCGNGKFVKLCLNHKIDALGVDKNSSPSECIVHSTIEKLKLKRKFNVITMYHILEHIKEPEAVLKKVRNFLTEEGTLVLEIPLVGNYTQVFLNKKYFAYYDKTHRHFFTKKQIVRLLNKTGYAVVKKGITIYEFPLTVITTSFRQGTIRGLVGLILFLPLKILTLFGFNDEIIRLYCIKKTKN